MTDTRSRFAHVAGIYGPVALVVFAVVFALVLGLAWRYRAGRDRGERRTGPASAPRLEAVYVLALVVIAGLLSALALRTDARESRAAQPALTIRVMAAQWNWRFSYPAAGGYTTVNTLVVPTGRTVRFELGALDVIHAMWIPARRFKRDAIPGRTTSFALRFPVRGTYTEDGACSEFCGVGHAGMRFTVRALPAARFDAWLRGHEAAS